MSNGKKSYLQLKADMLQLQREMEHAKTVERPNALEECKRLIAEFEFTTEELDLATFVNVSAKKPAKSEATFAVKTPHRKGRVVFQDPKTGATWSGYGYTPKWLEGKNMEEYAVGKEGREWLKNHKDRVPKRPTQNNSAFNTPLNPVLKPNILPKKD